MNTRKILEIFIFSYRIYSIPKEIYNPDIGIIADQVNTKLKTGYDVTDTLICGENTLAKDNKVKEDSQF